MIMSSMSKCASLTTPCFGQPQNSKNHGSILIKARNLHNGYACHEMSQKK